MRACMCVHASSRRHGCAKKRVPAGRGNEGMKSHRFSGNLIKPSGDEDKAIQYVAAFVQEECASRLVLSTHFDNDFLASASLARINTRVCFIHIYIYICM